MKLELSLELLKESLEYRDGDFYWRSDRPVSHFQTFHAYLSTTSRLSGQKAGSIDKTTGYLTIRLFEKLYHAHRLVWFYHFGKLPTMNLDHKDGNKLNNKLDNLREATKTENGRNCAISKNNTSGVNGVYWSTSCKAWVAEGHSMVAGKKIKHYLGSFKNIEDAKKARETWEKSEGNFSTTHGKRENNG